MPDIRNMKPEEFQNLLALGDEDLNAVYDSMTCLEQQDFILRIIRESHPVLKSMNVSLSMLKEVVVNHQFGTQNLWNGVRTYLTAADIRKNSGQIALALFGDYILNVSYLNQNRSAGGQALTDSGAIDTAYQDTEELVARAKRAEQLNFVQISEDPPIFQDNQPMEINDLVGMGSGQVPGQDFAMEQLVNPDDDLDRDMFAYEIQTDPKTGLVLHGGIPQPIGPNLTDEIISTGNRKVLESFYRENKKKLTEKEDKYLRCRIKAAKKIEKLEKKALMHAAYGEREKIPGDLQIEEDANGFLGFTDLHLHEPQSSKNGCWSCSFHLLLKSRGIDLSQEDIRAFRVDLGDNTKDQVKVTNDYRVRMNMDTVNNLFENGDLLMKVLPNTSLKQFTLNPMTEMPLSLKVGNEQPKPLSPAQAAVFEQYYIAQTKEKLQKVITDALIVDKSPIAITWGGHYVTITGISPDGRIRVEDSARSRKNNHTQILDLTEVIKESLYGQKGMDKVPATGLSLCWLKDIKVPEYGKVTQENCELGNAPGVVRINQDGQLSCNIKDNADMALMGSPATGQGAGDNLSEVMYMDQKDMHSLLGGSLEGFGGVEGRVMIGNMETYYPKKVHMAGDPKLEQYKYNPQDEVIGTIRGLMESSLYTLHFDQKISIEPVFRKYIQALEELSLDHEPEDMKQVENAKKTLRELHDLFRQPHEDGRTYFQVLQEGLQLKNREKFREMWDRLDKSAGLGLNLHEIQYVPEPVRRFELGMPAMDAEPTKPFLQHMYRHWKSIEGKMADPHYHRSEIEEQLSMIIATEEKWTEAIEISQSEGKQIAYEGESIKQSAKMIRQSKAFIKLMEKDNFIKLAKSGSSVELVNAYRDAERIMGDRDKSNYLGYAGDKKEFGEQYNRISAIYREMRNTRTGSYLGWGIISRRHNSAKYEKAFAALKSLKDSCRGADDAKVRYLACLDIMDYLKGKEIMPNRSFGKKRWEGFMTALAEVMPRDEFEKYCDHINEVRGVREHPERDEYIGPENFYKNGETMENMLADSRARIKAGRATERDYARSAILETLKKEGRTSVTRTELRKLTDSALKSKEYQLVMQEQTPGKPNNEKGPAPFIKH